MTLQPFALITVLLAALAVGLASDARADDDLPPDPHIRTTDSRLRALLDDAIAASPTVRALVTRIAVSDVVVYLACEQDPHVRMSGRLNFVPSAGGLRYVIVRLKKRAARRAAIATLAHELQHAVEIADNPSIVDDMSMAREYERIGYRSHSAHGQAFDTKAAVEVGRRVREELERTEESDRSSPVIVARSAS